MCTNPQIFGTSPLGPAGFEAFSTKDWAAKKVTISILFFSIKNLWRCFNFFTYILIDYSFHEITKEFWKNSHFVNMRAGFLQMCQKSLRCKISLICLWNVESLKQKLVFAYVLSQNWSKYHLNTIQTTFSEKNNHLGTMWLKIFFFSCLKMHYFRGISPKWVLTL